VPRPVLRGRAHVAVAGRRYWGLPQLSGDGADCDTRPIVDQCRFRIRAGDHHGNTIHANIWKRKTDMFGGIVDNLVNAGGSFLGNLGSRLLDMAPGAITSMLSVAANTVLPGSGPIVQAIAGPLVDAAVDLFGQAVDTALLPAVQDTLEGLDLSDVEGGDFIANLASNFVDGLAAGFNG